MRALGKTIFLAIAVYMSAWFALAAYFSYADGHESLLESSLSRVFNRPVSIGNVTTDWNGFSPRIYIENFEVQGDTAEHPALAFRSLAAELSAFSLLRLWPQFSEFAIAHPQLEVVSLSADQVQVAGIALQSRRSAGINPKRLISWMLNHRSLVWHDGVVVWRRLDGEIQRYTGTSFVYHRYKQKRLVRATTVTPKGGLAFKASSRGKVLEEDNWDAEFEVLGSRGERLLAPEDLSLEVNNGRGRMALKTLNVERVRDFLRLSGLGTRLGWILQSQLSGRLHDVEFEFSGPLLEFREWSLRANASQIAFQSVFRAPAMDKLSGQLVATSKGGVFEFAADDSVFAWPRWFEQSFPIASASGGLHWTLSAQGNLEMSLIDASFKDSVISLSELNAEIEIDTQTPNVANLGQLFKVKSIADLSFEGGQVVSPDTDSDSGLQPIYLDASANFDVSDMARMDRYLPNEKNLNKLRIWWDNAVISGQASGGRMSYRGEISSNAIYVGKALLEASVDYSGVEIDYGYQRQWPRVVNGSGRAVLKNDLLDFQPEEVWLEEDQILQPGLQISNLFKLDRQLDLTGSMNTSLNMVTEFLFNGPLIPQSSVKETLPVKVDAGRVVADMTISVPLRRVSLTKVKGIAEVSNGRIILPSAVPVDDINTTIRFTERSASAEQVNASFLGHPTSGKIITTEIARPPVLKMSASGIGEAKALTPWVGEHLASCLDGSYPWQGSVLFDGPRIEVELESNLRGLTITAPEPLQKSAEQERQLTLTMQQGPPSIQKALSMNLGSDLNLRLQGNLEKQNSLLDRGHISLGDIDPEIHNAAMQEGIHFDVRDSQFDLDRWLSAIIDLANLELEFETDPEFLDAMRSVQVTAANTEFLGGPFGELKLTAESADGAHWVAAVNGENIEGGLHAEPRDDIPNYRFNLSRLRIPSSQDSDDPADPVDHTLMPADYPHFELVASSFTLGDKKLGRMEMLGRPTGEIWTLEKFNLTDLGISTVASGSWVNNEELGSISDFRYQTTIEELGDVLEGMDFDGVLRKGRGEMVGNLKWIGAPHEFDYGRLNGDFDLRIRDGELVQIEPGGGKLLGLLNFNAIARRLTLDFRDLFSSGLQFDRMRYAGLLADGAAIMRDAYIFSPAVFVQMEGKLDLDKELIDMEIHMSPELGGNLTLLSALANPAAGAVMFLTQQLFKDEMRASSFQSYRALGGWEDFELEEIRDQAPSQASGSVNPDKSAQNQN